MIVVDTNVMVYLLTGAGPAAEAARLLRRDPAWASPPLLQSELRDVMAGLIRQGRVEESDAVAICDDAKAILGDRVATVPTAPVLRTARESGLSAYDAEFVVLARTLGVPLMTADQAVLEGAPDVAVGL